MQRRTIKYDKKQRCKSKYCTFTTTYYLPNLYPIGQNYANKVARKWQRRLEETS